jgi:hypothetical protein
MLVRGIEVGVREGVGPEERIGRLGDAQENERAHRHLCTSKVCASEG